MLDDRKPPRMLAFGEKEKKDPKIEKVDSGERRLRNGREDEPDITYFYLDGIQAGQCTIQLAYTEPIDDQELPKYWDGEKTWPKGSTVFNFDVVVAF